MNCFSINQSMVRGHKNRLWNSVTNCSWINQSKVRGHKNRLWNYVTNCSWINQNTVRRHKDRPWNSVMNCSWINQSTVRGHKDRLWNWTTAELIKMRFENTKIDSRITHAVAKKSMVVANSVERLRVILIRRPLLCQVQAPAASWTSPSALLLLLLLLSPDLLEIWETRREAARDIRRPSLCELKPTFVLLAETL